LTTKSTNSTKIFYCFKIFVLFVLFVVKNPGLNLPANVVGLKCTILFGQRDLSDILAREAFYSLHSRKGSEWLARVDLARWCDRLDPGCPTDMRAGVVLFLDHRLFARIHRACV